jgi:hypothetical protein
MISHVDDVNICPIYDISDRSAQFELATDLVQLVTLYPLTLSNEGRKYAYIMY